MRDAFPCLTAQPCDRTAKKFTDILFDDLLLLLMYLDSHICRGGIRGIVELEVLRAIQERLNNRIPIRAFFDLIVGTR